jgi:hypothetical protein
MKYRSKYLNISQFLKEAVVCVPLDASIEYSTAAEEPVAGEVAAGEAVAEVAVVDEAVVVEDCVAGETVVEETAAEEIGAVGGTDQTAKLKQLVELK